MNSDFYPFLSDEDCLFFEFESISKTRTIKKIITFTPIPKQLDVYNLAFGDIQSNGEFSDMSISNNQDTAKVFSTVIQSITRFFKKFPDALVFIKGSTSGRTRLYRIIISKEIASGNNCFEIYGVINDQIELFIADRLYEAFVISLKQHPF